MKSRVVGFAWWSLCGLAALPFLRAWNYGLIDLDDYVYLTRVPYVSTWQGWESIRFFFSDVSQGIWMPLTWASYALDFAIFGSWHGGYHLHSILLHLVNSVLLFAFLRTLFNRLPDYRSKPNILAFCCLSATLLWALHPLRCESVILLSSRKDVLSLMWELVALILWVKGGIWRTAFSLVAFTLGAMSKPSVMTFPVLCFLVDFILLRRVNILRYALPSLMAIALGAFAGWQQKMGGTTVDVFNQPLWGKILGACAAFGIYLRNTVWPQWLAPQCIKTWPALPRFWLPGVVISALVGWYLLKGVFRYWDNRKTLISTDYYDDLPIRWNVLSDPDPLLLGMAWFSIAIAPMLGIANFGFHAFADRFTYIPSIGLSIVFLFILWRMAQGGFRMLAFALTMCALGTLTCCTYWQTGFWINEDKLFTHTLEVDGNTNTFAHRVIANYAFEFQGDFKKCIAEYDTILAQNPYAALEGYELYIISLCEEGQTQLAQERLRQFVDILTKVYGTEISQKITSGNGGGDPAIQGLHAIYRHCKLATWIYSKDCDQLVDDYLGKIGKAQLEEMPTLAYLAMRHASLKGNDGEANRLKLLLLGNRHKDGLLQFRFLAKESK